MNRPIGKAVKPARRHDACNLKNFQAVQVNIVSRGNRRDKGALAIFSLPALGGHLHPASMPRPQALVQYWAGEAAERYSKQLDVSVWIVMAADNGGLMAEAAHLAAPAPDNVR